MKQKTEDLVSLCVFEDAGSNLFNEVKMSPLYSNNSMAKNRQNLYLPY